jgi:hypothetical protein
MRRLILAATLALGLGAIPGTASAAPGFASQPAMAAMSDIEQAQYHRGYYHGRRGYSAGPRYYGRPSRGYSRYYGGPPPHARAYGRRYNDRHWDRRW